MVFTTEQKAKFEELYKSALATQPGEKTRLVQIKDAMLQSLIDGNEATIKTMHPKSIVPHLKNRGGSKMQWSKIFKKGAKIMNVGVSLQECGPNKAVAFEENAEKSAAHAHIKLCRTSQHYAKYTDASIVEGVVSGAATGISFWRASSMRCPCRKRIKRTSATMIMPTWTPSV